MIFTLARDHPQRGAVGARPAGHVLMMVNFEDFVLEEVLTGTPIIVPGERLCRLVSRFRDHTRG